MRLTPRSGGEDVKPKIISLLYTLVFPSARGKKGMYPDTFQSECNTGIYALKQFYHVQPKTRENKDGKKLHLHLLAKMSGS